MVVFSSFHGGAQVGVLIGKGGETIRHLQYNSGAKIQITRDADSDPRSSTRSVELIGTLENIDKAEKLIKDVIAEVCLPFIICIVYAANCSSPFFLLHTICMFN